MNEGGTNMQSRATRVLGIWPAYSPSALPRSESSPWQQPKPSPYLEGEPTCQQETFESPWPTSGAQDLKRQPLEIPNFSVCALYVHTPSQTAVQWAAMQTIWGLPRYRAPIHQPATLICAKLFAHIAHFNLKNKPMKGDHNSCFTDTTAEAQRG